MTRQDIVDALHARLQQAPGLPDIAWLGVPYMPVQGSPYLVPRLSSYVRSTVGLGIDGAAQHDGTYTITVRASAEDGEASAASFSGDLVAWFGRHAAVNTTSGQPVLLLNASEQPASLAGDWLSIAVVVTFVASDA